MSLPQPFLKLDAQSRNIIAFAFWALVEALQWMIAIIVIYSFIPIKPHPFAVKLFPLHQNGVLPEREMFFYRLGVVLSVLLMGGGLSIFRRRWQDPALYKSLWGLTAAGMFWEFVQIFAAFKWFVTGNPLWAKYLLYAGLAGAVVCRVFWVEIQMIVPRIWNYGQNLMLNRLQKQWMDVGFVFLVGLIIYVPDMTKVLARIFVRDQFYHLDSFILAPGWANLQGLHLNQDVISQYSAVIPWVVSRITQAMGGLSYWHVLSVLIVLTILYYAGFYLFLRRWINSWLVAATGTLLLIKVQMFHWGVAPLIWQYPSATVIRWMFDLPLLFLLWKHLEHRKPIWLWSASAVCSMALAWMLDTGFYLWAAFVVYLVVDQGMNHTWKLWKNDGRRNVVLLLQGLWPWVGGFLLVWMIQGAGVWSKDYWTNALEFSQLFLNGWGALPMYDGLKDRQFFAFIMGFVIPVVYVMIMILTASLCFMRRIDRRNILVIILCVYGLGLYHYFVHRSAVSSYYVVAMPLMAVLSYLYWRLSQTFGHSMGRVLRSMGFAGVLFALLSSYFFIYYPNLFNLAGSESWKEEINFYRQEIDLKTDVELITAFTSNNEKVALISSFETHLLMQAKRKPFFYYFPLIESTHMRQAHFRGTYLHTQARLEKTLNQLDQQKPPYIFIEQKLFKGQLPPQYFQVYQSLDMLVKYLKNHYEPVKEGQYLMALKRKE